MQTQTIITIEDFNDERIEAITSGKSSLTENERAFLLADTPSFEECTSTAEELAAMSDADLMSTAYSVWADYVRCMY